MRTCNCACGLNFSHHFGVKVATKPKEFVTNWPLKKKINLEG